MSTNFLRHSVVACTHTNSCTTDKSTAVNANDGRERNLSGTLAPDLVVSVNECSKRLDKFLSRGELASLFAVSNRTIYRWEKSFSLPFIQRNARVIRYPIDAVILLAARGIAMNRENALRMGLLPDVILTVAAEQQQRHMKNGAAPFAHPASSQGVLIADSDDDIRLIEWWQHPERGKTLRALVRMFSTVANP